MRVKLADQTEYQVERVQEMVRTAEIEKGSMLALYLVQVTEGLLEVKEKFCAENLAELEVIRENNPSLFYRDYVLENITKDFLENSEIFSVTLVPKKTSSAGAE